ncbi:MAG: TAXI family TRAP transporter solute-binding subunit [Sneathiella sp.]|nr:TAXI family TRAP transporter solute-binding subunit [Sneathiella sp.]
MRIKFAIAIAASLTVFGAGSAVFAEETSLFRIGTGGIKGTYFPVGQAIAKTISNPLKKTDCAPEPCGVPGLLGVAQTSNGSLANIEDIQAGKIESGFSQSDIAFWGQTGTGVFDGKGANGNVVAIASLYVEDIHLVARKGSGIRKIEDLVGKRVSLDDPGSGTLVDARIILEAYGISEDKLKVQFVKAASAVRKIREGELDAFFIVAGHPAKSIIDLANEDLVTLIDIAGPAATRLARENNFFSPQTIPADSYHGIGAVRTLGVAALWVVSKNESTERVYNITRTFWENLPFIKQQGIHSKFNKIDLQTAFASMSIPLHPGALKYYDEIGLRVALLKKN